MNIEVGSYEAKTKLPELLRGIQAGNRYTITLRGEAVADLVPVQGNKASDAAAAVNDMFCFMQTHKSTADIDIRHRHQTSTSDIDIRALVNEGRA